MNQEADGGDTSLSEDEHLWALVRTLPEDDGDRIDRVLARRVDGVGRKLAGELCAAGDVRIFGRRVKKSTPTNAGDEILVRTAAWGEALPAPELPLNVVMETDAYVVVDKPAGISCAALVGQESGTMAGALLARYPEMGEIGYSRREPGILHRLDRYTSGLLVAARTQSAFATLRATLRAGAWKKKYLALVQADTLPDSGVVERRLITDPQDRSRVMPAGASEGYSCTTSYAVLRRGPRVDLVEAVACAAFRHQVRVHLATAGAPLIGDLLYGGEPFGIAPRHALHASFIQAAFDGSESFAIGAALPEDLLAVLEDDR